MILTETHRSDVMNCTALLRHDHVFVISGFQQGAKSSLENPTVLAILSHYLSRKNLRFTRDVSGKPKLEAVDGVTLHFSLSHVEDVLVLALSLDGDVGIDVEVIRERKYISQIARRYFDSEPKNIYDFYRAWTAREAFIKAIGSRISQSLAQIHTAKDGQELKIGLSTEHSHHVEYFSPRENFIAALCRKKSARRDVLVVPYNFGAD